MKSLTPRVIVFFAALLMPVLGTTGIAQTAPDISWNEALSRGATKVFWDVTPETVGACDTAGPIEIESTGGAITTPTAYANLGAAFTAINGGTAHLGAVTIEVCGDTTELVTARLNERPAVLQVLIRPTGGVARNISGTIAGGGIITLDGADNVTIDGLMTGGDSLTITNTSTSNTDETSTVFIRADATNNVLRNTTILGSSLGIAAQTGGTAVPVAATVLSNRGVSTGNDNLTIQNNYIGNAGANNHVAAVSVNGDVGAVSDNVSINNNKIYNFYGAFGASGIAVGGSTSGVSINGNRLYLTGTPSGMAAASYWEGIFVATTGNGNVVNNNTIGGANEFGGGMMTASGGRFAGIDLTQVGTTTATEVQGNTINGIHWTTTSGASTLGASPFNGILVKAGLVNMGQTSANTIGAGSGIGSAASGIFVTSSTTGTGINGIYATSANPVSIRNNVIGAIATGGTAGTGYVFRGIAIAGSGSHTVSGNLVGGSTAGSIAIGTSTTTGLTTAVGINSSASGTITSIGTTSGTGNTVQNINVNGTHVNSAFLGINSTGSTPTLNINYNTFTNNQLQTAGSGTVLYYGLVSVGGNSNTAININNNTLTSGAVTATGFDGLVSLFFVTGGSTACNLSIQNNSFAGFQYSGATGGTGNEFFGIHSQVSNRYASKNISGNTFNDLKLRSSAPVTLIFMNDATRNVTASNNSIVTGFEILGTSANGIIFLYNGGGTGATTGTHNVTNNNFSNAIVTTTATVLPIIWSPGSDVATGATVNLTGNTVANIVNSNAIGHITAITSEWSPAVNVSGNNVSQITSGGSVTGIKSTTFGAIASYTKNRIHSLTTTGTGGRAIGIDIDNGPWSLSTTSMTIANNLIGNLFAPNGTTERVVGMSLTQQAAGNLFKVYNNTIYLNAVSAGANFSATGIVASVNPTVDLRNNLVVNLSTPTGTGNAIAYRRTGASLTNYAAGSNNNSFYAGTPGPGRLIFFDGTNSDQTLADFKTRVSTRDSNSISANANFLSTVGSDANFLHINPAIVTLIESGAMPVPEVTDDFDGDARNAATPDIGADEFAGIGIDVTPPVINYLALANSNSTGNRTLNISVTDASGVPTAGVGLPAIYFRKNADAYVSSQCAHVSGDNYDCTIDAALMGGLSLGNTVSYYVAARDTVGNVSVSPAAGATGLTANPPAAATPPTSPNSYLIQSEFGGSINVGGSETITSLTNPGGLFENLNSGVLTGNLTVNLTSDLISETGAIALNQLSESGGSGYTVTIQASGAARQITGVNAGSLITLNGADRVQFSGLAFGPYGLTFTNNHPAGSIFTLQNDSSNNSVLGCSLQRGGSGNGGAGVFIANGTTTGNDNNVISGNRIGTITTGTFRFMYGVQADGTSDSVSNSDLSIMENDIYNATRSVQTADGVDNVTIAGNNIENSFGGGSFGVWMGALGGRTAGNNTIRDNRIHGFRSAGPSLYAINIANVESVNVTGNRIYDFAAIAGSPSFWGIAYDGVTGAPSAANITNNFIALGTASSGNARLIGIADFGKAGNTMIVDHNSVFIAGIDSGSSSTWATLRSTGTQSDHTSRNNIFINKRTGGSGNHFAAGDQTAGAGSHTSDGNFYAGNGQTAGIFMDFGSVSIGTPVTAAQWQAGPPTRDANSNFAQGTSFSNSSIFINDSVGDMHLRDSATAIVGHGLTSVPLTVDIDGDPRPTTTRRDRGADELVESEGGVYPSGTFYNGIMYSTDTFTGPVTITNQLFVSGEVNSNENLITLGCDAGMAANIGSGHLKGPLRKLFCGAHTTTIYPLGDGQPSPITISVSFAAPGSALTFRAYNQTLAGFNPGQSLSRNWEITETGNVTASLGFGYDASDINGNENDYRVYSRNGAGVVTNHCPFSPCVSVIGNQSTLITGVTNFSRWTMAQLLTPTAASVDVSGRVITADGRPIRNVEVMINGEGLQQPIFVYTGNLGYYNFEGLPAGNYVLTANSKRFTFNNPVRLITLKDSLTDQDFVAEAQE